MATSFFVHENFHLWMILLVLPTTGFSIFMGCRQHKDRRVATMSGIGLSILIGVLIYERARHAIHADAADQVLHCASCVRDISQNPVSMDAVGWINTIAGFVLAGAHIRNYRLCRKNRHCCEQ